MIETLTVLVFYFHLTQSRDYEDYINAHDKKALMQLGHEMIADAKMKINQIDAIRAEHSRFISFDAGYIIGEIREKYRMMMELYRISYNKINNLATLPPARTGHFRSIHYFVKMEYIHLLQMDIDKLVEVLETMPEHQGPFILPRSGNRDSEEEKHNALEEEVKRRYREEYLMRKLHSPGQRTTMKRFLDKWPVPNTWSLEKY